MRPSRTYFWVCTSLIRNNSTRMAFSAAGAARSGTTSNTTASCAATPIHNNSNHLSSFALAKKWQVSPNSWILRFQLPAGQTYLNRNDPTLPTCISVHYDGQDEKTGQDSILKKSYSPISHPSTKGTFDLLVKSYAPRPGGGVGAHICSIDPGQSITGKLKAERIMHGSPAVLGRWRNLGLVACGTGVAPLVQIARILLDDPEDNTKIRLLCVNRRENDVLMRKELDHLASDHPDRFSVTYSLTASDDISPTHDDWKGERGRGSVDMALRVLPPPSGADGSTMVLVCGTDGFVKMWAGPVGRAPPNPDGSKGPKIQGPLLGLLQEAGYDASEVFKY